MYDAWLGNINNNSISIKYKLRIIRLEEIIFYFQILCSYVGNFKIQLMMGDECVYRPLLQVMCGLFRNKH